ncbi:MAG: hypothetical protein ACRC62_03540 [Microcoleus sp.]
MIIKVVQSSGRQVVKVYQRGVFSQGGSATADQVPLNPPIAGLPATVQGAITNLLGVEFTQSVAAQTWTFNHTLNRVPKIDVTDLAGNKIYVETQVTLTQAIVRSVIPITGIVKLW